MKHKYIAPILIVLILVILIPRVIGLDQFVTVDEPSWVGYGGNFYYALGQRDINGILTKYSPGITTTYFGAASIHYLFPQYRGLGQGYLWNDDLGVAGVMEQYGQDPMEVLAVGRLFMVLAITCVLILVFIYTNKLLGKMTGLLSVLFISLDPYYLGHSRLLTHEGLISVLLILSILSYGSYLYKGRKRVDLFMSALAGSFACLTKSSAIIIVPFIILIGAFESMVTFRETKALQNSKNAKQFGKKNILSLLGWVAIFVIVYVLVWPPMWVDPINTIKHVYGSAFGIALGSNGGEGALSSSFFSGMSFSGFRHYLQVLLTKTTPFAWGAVLVGFAVMLIRLKEIGFNTQTRLLFYIILFASLFYTMMSLASNKAAPHYILTTLVCINFIAGVGISSGLKLLNDRFSRIVPNIGMAVVFTLLGVFTVINFSNHFPYYYTYNNPIIEKIDAGVFSPVQHEYGEGLDLAANYLSALPGAEKMTVYSWYAGTVAYKFPGEVYHLIIWDRWTNTEIKKLKNSDYLVIYYHHQKRRNSPSKLMADLQNVEPHHKIFLNGLEYVRIYDVSSLPGNVFEPEINEDGH